jgi:lysophospholipase L1-like esterase
VLGVLAFGDSITNGGGELQWGVALQSWALWVARGLGVPYTGYAEDGAFVQDVVGRQIEAHRAAQQSARYDVGCLYIGTNDVRALDWDPDAFARDYSKALAYLRERCERVLCVTIPLDLGRPRAGAKVEAANRIIEHAALGGVQGRPRAGAKVEAANRIIEHAAVGGVRGRPRAGANVEDANRIVEAAGTHVVDLRGFRGRRVLMTDHVHPTALGQVAIAERALDVLAADGVPVRIRPSALMSYERTRWGSLRGDATYAYRHAKVSLRAAAIVAAVRMGVL